MTRRSIFTTKGNISHDQAMKKAHKEFTKYKEKQDEALSSVEKHFINCIEQLNKADKLDS